MQIERLKEKCAGAINMVEIGLGKSMVKVGQETALPLLLEEGAIPNAPVVALEIYDCEPLDWPEAVRADFGDVLKDPVKWAKKCASISGVRLLCVRLQGPHPDALNRTSDESVKVLKSIAETVDVPLIVIGCGDDERDNELIPKASQALKGRNALFGIASQSNYKTMAATCLADGHSLIAESPIDVNIAKQLNILISDMGFDPRRIIMHPTTTSLGYGMEYVYSIMERSRLAAFMGDKMLSMPFILFVGQEVWKTKEAKESAKAQGVNWEVATSVSMLQSGADIVVVRHPSSAETIAKYIDSGMKG